MGFRGHDPVLGPSRAGCQRVVDQPLRELSSELFDHDVITLSNRTFFKHSSTCILCQESHHILGLDGRFPGSTRVNIGAHSPNRTGLTCLQDRSINLSAKRASVDNVGIEPTATSLQKRSAPLAVSPMGCMTRIELVSSASQAVALPLSYIHSAPARTCTGPWSLEDSHSTR